jgi:hypothetical protein
MDVVEVVVVLLLLLLLFVYQVAALSDPLSRAFGLFYYPNHVTHIHVPVPEITPLITWNFGQACYPCY